MILLVVVVQLCVAAVTLQQHYVCCCNKKQNKIIQNKTSNQRKEEEFQISRHTSHQSSTPSTTEMSSARKTLFHTTSLTGCVASSSCVFFIADFGLAEIDVEHALERGPFALQKPPHASRSVSFATVQESRKGDKHLPFGITHTHARSRLSLQNTQSLTSTRTHVCSRELTQHLSQPLWKTF